MSKRLRLVKVVVQPHFVLDDGTTIDPQTTIDLGNGITLDPTTGIRVVVEAHRADTGGPAPITLDMEFSEEGGEGPTPYEVLLHAALTGDSTRFTRQDAVEEAWRVMQPLLDAPPPVHSYAPGSWGPEEGEQLVAGYGRWHEPWIDT